MPLIYQLKVALNDSERPIWRRVQVRGDLTLRSLHHVLQEVMGWQNSHLHKFAIGEHEYAQPDAEYLDFDMKILDDRKPRLEDLVTGEGHCFTYEYDFGDGWTHSVLVEKILPIARYSHAALCVAGGGACPPEDVGGVDGYADFLQAIRDPAHEEHASLLTWCGGAWDAAGFDLNRVNRNLQRLDRRIGGPGAGPRRLSAA